jgi:mono/diheme cytochrome c family protein
MKYFIKNKIRFIAMAGFLFVSVSTIVSCVASQKVAEKSGGQLWAENCSRCHNNPSPGSFSDDQWVTIGMHMQTRALITEQERNKIVSFLQQGANRKDDY